MHFIHSRQQYGMNTVCFFSEKEHKKYCTILNDKIKILKFLCQLTLCLPTALTKAFLAMPGPGWFGTVISSSTILK